MPLYASDGDCDGGGPGAEYLGCQLGTREARASYLRLRMRRLRPALPASSAHLRRETRNWASDADCDDGGPGSEFRPAPGPILRCV
jgi:hypothetical protein